MSVPTIIIGLGLWVAISVLVVGTWGAYRYLLGNRDCHRPALVAARREESARRAEFVRLNMTWGDA
jgi:hypothetical protein